MSVDSVDGSIDPADPVDPSGADVDLSSSLPRPMLPNTFFIDEFEEDLIPPEACSPLMKNAMTIGTLRLMALRLWVVMFIRPIFTKSSPKSPSAVDKVDDKDAEDAEDAEEGRDIEMRREIDRPIRGERRDR